MTYDFAQHADEIAAWYRMTLSEHYPAGFDTEAKELFLGYRDRLAKEANREDAPQEVLAAAVQWNRVVLILAEAERDLGRPGWRGEWTDAYEHYVDGDDPVLGPYGPTGA